MATPAAEPVSVHDRASLTLAADAGAPQAVYAQRESIVLRKIAGEHLLVPIRHQLSEMRAIFAVTGTGIRIWELLDGVRPLGDVRDALVTRFEVAPEQAWQELCAFVEHLEESGLVERRR